MYFTSAGDTVPPPQKKDWLCSSVIEDLPNILDIQQSSSGSRDKFPVVWFPMVQLQKTNGIWSDLKKFLVVKLEPSELYFPI
jgi:hypothetical protein